jgi:hypothetical protein
MSKIQTDTSSSQQAVSGQKEMAGNERQKRLETALRENLFRRKQQARARKRPDNEASDKA